MFCNEIGYRFNWSSFRKQSNNINKWKFTLKYQHAISTLVEFHMKIHLFVFIVPKTERSECLQNSCLVKFIICSQSLSGIFVNFLGYILNSHTYYGASLFHNKTIERNSRTIFHKFGLLSGRPSNFRGIRIVDFR